MHRFRLLAFITTLVFVILLGIGVSLIARGYRFSPQNLEIKPTGILVVTSSPDGAQILINGQLETATNATINLVPNTYDVEVRQEGFLPWKKRLTIKKEEVTKVDTVLFPAAPNLSALTFSGAIKPTLSPDGNKIVFGIPENLEDTEENSKSGLWVMDLGNLPIGFSSDPRQITDIDPSSSSWFWSPDSRQILIVTPNSNFIAPAGEFTAERGLINLTGTRLETQLNTWEEEEMKRRESALENLEEPIRDLFERKVERFSFSPDGKKIMYLALSDFEIPEGVVTQIPGASSQKQERKVKKDHIYVYDIKEDRNFLISTRAQVENSNPSYRPSFSQGTQEKTPATLQALVAKLESFNRKVAWFPSSNHIVLAEKDKVTVMDYDATNQQVVWSGPYETPYALPSPSTNRLILLTRFGAGSSNTTNMYSLSLK